MKTTSTHPCLQCGACCAFFRVSFYWQETEKGFMPWTVPKAQVDVADALHVSMKETGQGKCNSLEGQLGSQVKCSLYENRPSPCRNFEASFEKGERNIRCDQARLSIGMSPLTPDDWNHPISPVTPTTTRPKRIA